MKKTLTPDEAKAAGVLDLQIFEGGMNTIISILTQDISAAWKNVTEWQKDMSKLPQIGKSAYKLHSFSLTSINLNSQLIQQAVPAMMLVVIMEKVAFNPLLKPE